MGRYIDRSIPLIYPYWMRSILSRFGLAPAGPPSSDTEIVRRIAGELDRLDPARAKYIAAFAYILSRVASADQSVSDDETKAMERLVVEKSGLPAEQAVIVVQMAKTQHMVSGGTDDFLVTREFAKMTTDDERVALVDCLFAVSAADHRILTVEANEIANIARELRVDPREVTRLRVAYREHLAVSQNLSLTNPNDAADS